MKFLTFRALVGLVGLLFFANYSSSIKIRPPPSFSLENNPGGVVIRQIPVERDLGGDEDKPVSLPVLRLMVEKFIKKEIGNYFDGSKIHGSEKQFQVMINEHELFLLKVMETTDEVAKMESVVIQMNNPVLNSIISLEKTNFRPYVKMYLKLFLHNYFLKMRQVVISLEDIATDVGNMLSFVCRGVRAGFRESPDNKQDDRLLNSSSRGLKTDLVDYGEMDYSDNNPDRFKFRFPILKSVMVYPLDLKKVRYTSKKPRIMKQIQDSVVKSPFAGPVFSKLSGRKLLSEDSIRFVNPKLKYFSRKELQSDQFLDFGLVDSPTVQEKGGKHAVHFRLTPSRSNLSDVLGEITLENSMVKVQFYNTAFSTTLDLSIPTKRFVVKSIREELDEMIKLLNIVENLTHLREWKHSSNPKTRRQTIIQEFIEPNYIYAMFEEEFHNLSEGASYADDDGQSVIKITNKNSSDMSAWSSTIYQRIDGILVERIEDVMEFEQYGAPFMIMRTYCTLRNLPNADMFYLGSRAVPDMSMFNQHFLVLRNIQLQSEIALHYMKIEIIRGVVFPFITHALLYPSETSVPPMVHDTNPVYDIRDIKKIYDKGEVSLSEPGTKIGIQMCPIMSEIHSHHIYTQPKDNGGFSFEHSDFQYKRRWDVDYCSFKIKLPSEGEEADERRVRRKILMLL